MVVAADRVESVLLIVVMVEAVTVDIIEILCGLLVLHLTLWLVVSVARIYQLGACKLWLAGSTFDAVAVVWGCTT